MKRILPLFLFVLSASAAMVDSGLSYFDAADDDLARNVPRGAIGGSWHRAAPGGTLQLAFDVNGGRTPLGRRDRGRHRFRVRVECERADGARADGEWARDPEIEDGAVDDDPDSWQTVRIPLAKLLPEGATALARLTIQFTGLPESGRAGLLVRDFRIESRKP